MTTKSNPIFKWTITGAAAAVITAFFYLIVVMKARDAASAYLLNVVPPVLGCVALLALSGSAGSPYPSAVTLMFTFLLSAGSAYQTVLCISSPDMPSPTKVFLLHSVALVVAATALSLYILVIKKKVLISRRGYRVAIYTVGCTIIVLFAVLMAFGTNIGGARLWIRIGSQTLELTEIIKLLFIFLLALIYNSNMNVKEKVIFGAVAMGMSAFFLALLNEFGTVIILFFIYLISFYIHIRTRYSLLLIGVFVIIMGVALTIIFGMHEQLKDKVGFFADKLNKIYARLTLEDTDQMKRALQGMINGGLFGADMSYLIYVYSIEADFALAGISQYFGLVIMLLCVVVATAIVYLVYLAGRDDTLSSRSRYKLAFLCTIAIAVQAMLSLCGNIGLPCAGVGMPGISAGGTQLVTLYTEAAFIVYGLSDNDEPIRIPHNQKIDRRNFYVEDEV